MLDRVTSVYAPILAPLASKVSDPRDAKAVSSANTALDTLMQSQDYVDSLVSHSQRYLPPTSIQVMSTLWGMFNITGTTEVTQETLEDAVVAQGGSYTAAADLWKMIKPEDKSSLTTDEFAKNTYLLNAMSLVYEKVQDKVEERRLETMLQGTTTTNTLFDFYSDSSGSGSVLDFKI